MSSEYAVKTSGLYKAYNGRPAVDHVDMHVKKGEIYGFIGQNGSGKSTTLKLLSGLVRSDGGEISIFGRPVSDELTRKRTGILIEAPGLYKNLTARDNLELMAAALGLTDKSSIDRVLAVTGLEHTGKKKTGRFSMGMKQRLGIAMALLGNPDLLLLDEPVNGLDPEGIREIRECLLRLNEDGVTIIISSHILGELSKLSTCYGIIKNGKLIRELSTDQLLESCRDYLHMEVDDVEKASFILQEHGNTLSFQVCDRHTLHVFNCPDPGELTSLLVSNQVKVMSSYMHTQDLEQYFLELMKGGRTDV